MTRPEVLPTHTADQLRAVARSQQLVLLCLGVQAALLVGYVFVTATMLDDNTGRAPALFLVLTVLWVLVNLAGGVVGGLLAAQLHGTAAGVILGPLSAVPCLGFVVLLVTAVVANGVFRRHGVRVGLFGAKAADLANLDLAPIDDGAGVYPPDEDEGW